MRKTSPTLVWSAKPNNPNILVYSLENSVSQFVDAVFSAKRQSFKTDRLIRRNGKLYYNPSDEYREYVVRIRRIK
jgi:hypothetical protein